MTDLQGENQGTHLTLIKNMVHGMDNSSRFSLKKQHQGPPGNRKEKPPCVNEIGQGFDTLIWVQNDCLSYPCQKGPEIKTSSMQSVT